MPIHVVHYFIGHSNVLLQFMWFKKKLMNGHAVRRFVQSNVLIAIWFDLMESIFIPKQTDAIFSRSSDMRGHISDDTAFDPHSFSVSFRWEVDRKLFNLLTRSMTTLDSVSN